MKNIIDVDVFGITTLQDKQATLYYHKKDDQAYIYIGAEKFGVGDMVLNVEGDLPLEQKLKVFRFTGDVKLDGVIAILQEDHYYMVTFVTPTFSGLNGEEALNDVIILKIGNALNDVN